MDIGIVDSFQYPRQCLYEMIVEGYPVFFLTKKFLLFQLPQFYNKAEMMIKSNNDKYGSLDIKDQSIRGHRGRDGMVVGFITTCAISFYHH